MKGKLPEDKDHGWKMPYWMKKIASTCYYYYYRLYMKIVQSKIYYFVQAYRKGLSIAFMDHQTLVIPYMFEGKEYRVYVPFQRRLVPKMKNQSIHLLFQNEGKKEESDEESALQIFQKIEMKQQPGVPYLISPGQLGAVGAIVSDLECERTIGRDEKI